MFIAAETSLRELPIDNVALHQRDRNSALIDRKLALPALSLPVGIQVVPHVGRCMKTLSARTSQRYWSPVMLAKSKETKQHDVEDKLVFDTVERVVHIASSSSIFTLPVRLSNSLIRGE